MINDYRAWLPSQPEPDQGFPIRAAAPESAARILVEELYSLSDAVTQKRFDAAFVLKNRPQLVLVRERDSLRTDPHRIHVTADIEISVWGYPAEIDEEGTQG